MYKIQSGKNDILIIPSQKKKSFKSPSGEKISAKSIQRSGWTKGKGNERTNKHYAEARPRRSRVSKNERAQTTTTTTGARKNRRRLDDRFRPTSRWVEQWPTAFCNLYLSARGRIRERKREQWGGGWGKRKQNARRRRRDIHIHGSLSCSTFDRRKRKEERRAKHELFPASVVQKPRGILVFPTIHNALSIINRVRNRKEERERKGDGESILFLEKNTPPRRPFL